jgi:hypothetical protein
MHSFVLGFAVLVGSGLAQSEARSPVPSQSDLAEADKLVKSFYKTDLAKLKTADRIVLAARFIEQSRECKDDLKTKYVLLRDARDVAARAGDPDVYLKAADEMAASFKISAADARAADVDVLVGGISGVEPTYDAAQALLEAADAALGAGDFDAAQRLLRGAETLGRRTGVASLTTAIGALAKSLAILRKSYDKLADAQKKLETEPADGAANLLVGKFLCFVKNDWEAGLPRLALSSDNGLRLAAEKDAKAETGPPADKAEAGDAWGKLAANLHPLEKANLSERAVHWHRGALADAEGLLKIRAEKRIAELDKAVVAWASERPMKWAAIKSAVKDGFLKEWDVLGGGQKNFREVPPSGAVLIGFRYSANGKNTPDFFQAIYRGPKGEILGAATGNPRGAIVATKAKAGYAVGAIYTRTGSWLDAIQPIFMKLTSSGVDPNDSYKGPFLGGEGGGPTLLGGDGNFVVGIRGRVDNGSGRIQALSPITMTTNFGPLVKQGQKKD